MVKSRRFWTKWRHRKLLNFSPHMDTQNVRLQMEQFPQREMQNLATYMATEKITTSNLVGKAETLSAINPTPSTM